MAKSDIKISPEFKVQSIKAMAAVAFFISIYVLLLLLTIGAMIGFAYIILIIAERYPGTLSIYIGFGLMSFGLLLLFFLLKFFFKSHKVDHSHLLEITRTEEPELFKLIDEIVAEVQTNTPKKVYLSAEVNAHVFYDSSFWSLFFPIKKNLQIGLGLVNTVNQGEFKALLAHEFGHFSQRTMKIGSYAYQVNQIIDHLLYDNKSYDELIQAWASLGKYSSFIIHIVVKMIKGIQWILEKLYPIVNKHCCGLSREMEYHADAIAASVGGSEPFKNGLLRTTLAREATDEVLDYYKYRNKKDSKSENLYKEQFLVMNLIAQKMGIAIVNELPHVTIKSLSRLNKSKLVIEDQYASHPRTEERIERLTQNDIQLEKANTILANRIFKNIESYQKKFTERLFQQEEYQNETDVIPFNEFQEIYKKKFAKNSFPAIYNGYYNSHSPTFFEVKNTPPIEEVNTIQELFSDQKIDLLYATKSLDNDISRVDWISKMPDSTKSFNYDGKKYSEKESKELLEKLQLESEQTVEEIKQNDIRIFNFFSKQETKQNSSKLVDLYEDFFKYKPLFKDKIRICSALTINLTLLDYKAPFDEFMADLQEIEAAELKFRSELKELLENATYEEEITKEVKDHFELYLSQKWTYFEEGERYEDNLDVLITAIYNYVDILSNKVLFLKRNLLDYQMELISDR